MNNTQKILSKLFSSDYNSPDLIELLNSIDSIAFCKQIISLKTKLEYNSKITLFGDSNEDLNKKILKHIEIARQKLTGKQLDELWDCFSVSLDVNCWGGEVWAPKILLNGSVLIRNHHRVIGFSDSLEGNITIQNSLLLKKLKDIEKITEPDDFSVLHNSENGVSWSTTLPKNLSNCGQTLLIVSKNLIDKLIEKSPNHFLLNPIIKQSIENSRTGHCVIRVFEKQSFIYSTYRASDEYDTILEYYSLYLGEAPNQESDIDLNISTNYLKLQNNISEQIKENNPSILSLNTNTLINFRLEQLIYLKYAQLKSWQIMEHTPIFNSNHLLPTTYSSTELNFIDESKKHQGNLWVAEINFSSTKSPLKFSSKLKSIIKSMISKYGDDNTYIYLPIPDPSSNNNFHYEDPNDFFIPTSNELNKRIKEIQPIINQQFEADFLNQTLEEKETNQYEFFLNYNFTFSILFVSEDAHDLNLLHNFGLKISNELDTSLSILIPTYGFNQGYCEGELDTGNLQFLLKTDY